MHTIPTL